MSVEEEERGFFGRLARMVQRRPGVVLVLTAALPFIAGAPVLGTTVRRSAVAGVPPDVESVQVLNELASRFGTVQEPAVIVVARTDAATLDAWARRWNADPAVSAVRPALRVGKDLATVEINVSGDTQSEAVQSLVRRVRANRPPRVASWVTGEAAVLVGVRFGRYRGFS